MTLISNTAGWMDGRPTWTWYWLDDVVVVRHSVRDTVYITYVCICMYVCMVCIICEMRVWEDRERERVNEWEKQRYRTTLTQENAKVTDWLLFDDIAHSSHNNERKHTWLVVVVCQLLYCHHVCQIIRTRLTRWWDDGRTRERRHTCKYNHYHAMCG